MNHPFRPERHAAAEPPTYEGDVFAWAMRQARLLRERRLDEIDWDNVAEEIETVGRSERRSLRSHLVQLLLHMLKWDGQPERRGTSRLVSIGNHRSEALTDLRENPSLKSSLDVMFLEALEEARRAASVETQLPRSVFDALDYTIEQAFDRPFELPERS
jgi:hypothetical protein